MTRRAIGAVALVAVLMGMVAGCAGGKGSAVEGHFSIHQLQAQEAAHEARLRAAAEARAMRLQNLRPIRGTGTSHRHAAQIALRSLGAPYVWGGANPHGFDNSGLVKYVYAKLGISLPHNTMSQWHVTRPISRSGMKPGDLVFFDKLDHVGIYIGQGQFVGAPHAGAAVRIESLAAWRGSFDGARRVP